MESGKVDAQSDAPMIRFLFAWCLIAALRLRGRSSANAFERYWVGAPAPSRCCLTSYALFSIVNMFENTI